MEVGGLLPNESDTVRVEEEEEMDGLPIPALEVDRREKSAAVGLSAHWMAWIDGWAVGGCGPAAERTDGVNLPPNMQASARC